MGREGIADYLNIEIAAQRVNSVEDAHAWFEHFFLAAESKISSNKSEYKGTFKILEYYTYVLLAMIRLALDDLKEAELIHLQEKSIVPSQMCLIVARNFISIKTFSYYNLHLSKEVSEDIDSLLQVICSCPESKSNFNFRNGDKQHLFKIASDSRLKFPLKDTKLDEPWKKLFLLLQVWLQSDLADIYEQLPPSVSAEAKTIREFLLRQLKCKNPY